MISFMCVTVVYKEVIVAADVRDDGVRNGNPRSP